MKKIIPFLIVFPFYCFGQKNEISLKYYSGEFFKGNFVMNSKDTVDDHQKLENNSNNVVLTYSRFFKNDIYVRLGYGLIYSHVNIDDNINYGSELHHQIMHYGQYNHQLSLSAGKQYSFNFCDIQIGGDLICTIKPKLSTTGRSEITDLSGNLESYQIVTNSYAPYYYTGLYLNTAIYFKIYRPFYLGLELQNGLQLQTNKGELNYKWQFYDQDGIFIKEETQNNYMNQTVLRTDFLNIALSLRFKFGDIKLKDKKIK